MAKFWQYSFKAAALLYSFILAKVLGLSDNRCYLENGASSESFFISEDLPVGAKIGQIRVHGDPGPIGNIALNLKEAADSPVSIAPGTKDLILRRKVDKEGIEGPSSVFVNVICERLHTPDPGFVIPINIRITDANDNAPIFINAPYILNISEVTVVGTRVLQGVHAIDDDQQGPFSNVKYQVLPGPNSDYFEFENELEGTLVLKKPLDYESLKTFDVYIRALDHGEPPQKTDTILTVNVIDADDQNPKFLDDRYYANIPEPARKGAVLDVKPRQIQALDQDLGINSPVYYTFNGIGPDYTLFKINRLTGRISLARDLNEELLHPATLVIRATQQDNPDRYALATITITKNSANSIRFLHNIYLIKVKENTKPGTVIGHFANNRPNQSLNYFVSDQSVLKTFSINNKGDLVLRKKLDFEEKTDYVFRIFATDGITNDSSTVNVSVEDINEWEPRFRYPHYEFFVSGLPDELIGKIEAADGDRNDKLTFSLVGANASLFFITPKGDLRLRESGIGAKGVANFAIIATDSGNPPKKTSVPVSVHFPQDGEIAGISSRTGYNGVPMLLAGLGAILLVLMFVIALLVAYICKAKRRGRDGLPAGSSEKTQQDRISNPMFGDRLRSPTATAIGGIPSSDTIKSKIPSPKVHPAPQPPHLWPSSSSSTRVKKLSWGDKTDSDSSDNINNMDTNPKLIDNTNLTVYF